MNTGKGAWSFGSRRIEDRLMKATTSSGQRATGHRRQRHGRPPLCRTTGQPRRLQQFEYGCSARRQRAYDRVHLSEYFGGSCAETLALCEHDFYAASGVYLHLGEAVLQIDRERGEVVTAQGRYGYDQLVLATGSYPFVPPIEGSSGDARLVYRPSTTSMAFALPPPAPAVAWWWGWPAGAGSGQRPQVARPGSPWWSSRHG